VLVWSLVLFVLGNLLSYSLVGQNRQKAYLGVLTLGAVVNVGLNLLLIGPFGILGASVARLAAQAVVLIVAYGLLHRALGFSLTREFIRTATAAVVMGVGLLVGLNWPLPVTIPLAVMLYIGTLVLVQGVTSADIRLLREIVFSR
jgi:O-antigen/teichoic acid export membrane protein